MSTSSERNSVESNNDNKKSFEEQVYSDSGFITSELLSSEQLSEEIKSGADNKSQETDMTAKATGKSQHSKDKEVENYTDSGIVSCSNISSSSLSTPQTKGMLILDVQPYVPEYMLRSPHNSKRIPQHPSLQIEKYFEQDEDGYTKLHIAILHNIEPAIQVLINYAPDPSYLDIRNYSGQSALHLAVLLNQSLTIKRLIDAGADVNIRDNRCNSPLHLAVLNEDINSVKVILAAIYPPIKSSNEVKLIANLEQWNYDGETCFYVACRLRNIPILKLLAKNGANINAREGRSGYSALHLAVETHSNDIIKFLCEDCDTIDLDYENYGGLTAFQLSLLTNQESMANYLVKKGATAYYTPESDYDDDSDVSTNDFEELEKNQLVNKIAEIAVN